MDTQLKVHLWALKEVAMETDSCSAGLSQENQDEDMKDSFSYNKLTGMPVESGRGRPTRRKIRPSRLLFMVVGVLLFGLLLTFLNIYQLRSLQGDHFGRGEVEPSTSDIKRRIVWVSGKKVDSGYLKHVFNVFERIGFLRGLSFSDWDVLWSHDYPFITLHKHLVNLKPHQRVNHFPGSGYVTNKVNLVTSNLKHVPKAFRIPKETTAFKAFAKKHPDWKWVQKSNNHRGVKILSLEELDLKGENTFVQQYVDDPLLIDGRRFDIGIYTAITSINPLRVYINQGDWLVRFCPLEYHPFDPAILPKYVVNDNYLPVWKVPSLKKIYSGLGYTFRDTLLAYFQSQNYDIHKLQEAIEEVIRDVYISQEKNLIAAAAKYASSRNFFEMVRFDIVLDRQMNIYLLEVNMSPNLSTGHFAANKLLYEQVVFGLLNLVGIARTVPDDLPQSFEDEANMQVSNRDIHINALDCSAAKCYENCAKLECRLCGACLTADHKFTLKRAYLEHVNRRTWRRVMPVPFKHQGEALQWDPKKDAFFRNLTDRNQHMQLWFHGKCLQDDLWCN